MVPGFPVAAEDHGRGLEALRVIQRSEGDHQTFRVDLVAAVDRTAAGGAKPPADLDAVLSPAGEFGDLARQAEARHGIERSGGVPGAARALAMFAVAMRDHQRRT